MLKKLNDYEEGGQDIWTGGQREGGDPSSIWIFERFGRIIYQSFYLLF